MKRHLLAAAAVATLSIAGLGTAVIAADAPAAAAAADLAKAPRMGTWGFDLAGQDRSVKPGDDFFRYANGTYFDQMVIPADRSSWGASGKLRELSDARSRAIIETAARTPNAKGEARQIGGLYNSFMDEARLEALGARPLAADFAAVKGARTHDALAVLMGGGNGKFGNTVFGVGIGPEAADPTKYAVYVGQAGLGLPDRDYYLTEQFAAKKTAYRNYVARILTLAGWANPEANADAIVAFETKIAEASWSKVQQRDPVASVNPMTVAELGKLAPEFNWKGYFTAAGLGAEQNIIVGEKSAFPKIAALYKATPIETLQAWEAFHIADQASPYLSKAFADANFEFRARTLSGQPEQRARWKRGVGLTGGTLGEAIGKLYVEAYFPAESKAQMEELVGNLLVAMKARINNLTWMSPETKAKALAKANSFTVKVGYPDEWRDYSKLTIKADDLYGNIERAGAFNWDYQVARLHKPVDKKEWGMFPQTVNAYYNPQLNEIVFPAAILQPPFFDPEADPAVNYGAIGAVIGHEISHGFDDQGRKYDADGSLNDWWQADDSAQFDARKGRLGAMYGAFEPLEGFKLNGDLTMGENIGDLGGLLIALDAYHLSLGGKPAPIIDGFTGDQRFFLGFAQIWRAKARDEAMKQQVTTGPHSPPYFRAYGTVRNIDAWYDAFDVKEGDAMYVKPSDRARIW